MEPVPVCQPIDRDHGVVPIRAARQVERRAQRAFVHRTSPTWVIFVGEQHVAVHDQAEAPPQPAADHGYLGRSVGRGRTGCVSSAAAEYPDSTPCPSTNRYAASERSNKPGGSGQARA